MRRAEKRRGDGASGRVGEQIAETSNAGEPRKLDPADKVVIGYLTVLTALILVFSYRIDLWVWLCASHVIAILLVVFIAKLEPSPPPLAPSLPRPFASFLHDWYPVALIPLTYKELSYLIPRIHPRDFDTALAGIDYRIFGAHPTVWLERFTWPPLTELLQLCYPTYYFLPIVLGAVIWRSGNRERYPFWVFIVAFGFYLSYLGYIAVPAIGPRFLPEILAAQTKPLTGVFLFQTVREALDRAEGLTRDCFPSGHTEITLLTLYYARRFHRKTFWVLLPFGVGIILSTVYLRYHYVIDVAAGALLAFLIVVVADRVYRAMGGSHTLA